MAKRRTENVSVQASYPGAINDCLAMVTGVLSEESTQRCEKYNHPGKYARKVLFDKSNELEKLKDGRVGNARGGIKDLESVKETVFRGKGIALKKYESLWICLHYFRCNEKMKWPTITISKKVHIHAMRKLDYKLDRTTINHALNKLTAIGFLHVFFDGRGSKYNHYGLTNKVRREGIEWFLSKENLWKNGGVFESIPGPSNGPLDINGRTAIEELDSI